MAESGCLRDAHFQNLQVSGKPFFSRANNVTQVAANSGVTSNGATGTIVLADTTYNTIGASRFNRSAHGVDRNGFWLHNNHINAESTLLFTLDHNDSGRGGIQTIVNNAFSITTNQITSLKAGVKITAIGNGRITTSLGNLNYLVIN